VVDENNGEVDGGRYGVQYDALHAGGKNAVPAGGPTIDNPFKRCRCQVIMLVNKFTIMELSSPTIKVLKGLKPWRS